jgi:hypothetical protein
MTLGLVSSIVGLLLLRNEWLQSGYREGALVRRPHDVEVFIH